MKTKQKPVSEDSFGIPAVFDIETTNLGADFGIILAAVVKPIGPFQPRIFRLDDYKRSIRDEDKHLVKAIRDELNRHDMVISWNGKRFDIPFINTRLMYHGLTEISDPIHFDLLIQARQKMRLRSRRLERVISFLEVKEKKTALEPKHWRWAMMGDKEAMDYVVHHCVQDVLSLELVAKRMMHLVKSVKR